MTSSHTRCTGAAAGVRVAARACASARRAVQRRTRARSVYTRAGAGGVPSHSACTCVSEFFPGHSPETLTRSAPQAIGAESAPGLDAPQHTNRGRHRTAMRRVTSCPSAQKFATALTQVRDNSPGRGWGRHASPSYNLGYNYEKEDFFTKVSDFVRSIDI